MTLSSIGATPRRRKAGSVQTRAAAAAATTGGRRAGGRRSAPGAARARPRRAAVRPRARRRAAREREDGADRGSASMPQCASRTTSRARSSETPPRQRDREELGAEARDGRRGCGAAHQRRGPSMGRDDERGARDKARDAQADSSTRVARRCRIRAPLRARSPRAAASPSAGQCRRARRAPRARRPLPPARRAVPPRAPAALRERRADRRRHVHAAATSRHAPPLRRHGVGERRTVRCRRCARGVPTGSPASAAQFPCARRCDAGLQQHREPQQRVGCGVGRGSCGRVDEDVGATSQAASSIGQPSGGVQHGPPDRREPARAARRHARRAARVRSRSRPAGRARDRPVPRALRAPRAAQARRRSLFAWSVPAPPSCPVLSAVRSSRTSSPRHSPTTSRSGRMRSASRTRRARPIPPAPSRFGCRASSRTWCGWSMRSSATSSIVTIRSPGSAPTEKRREQRRLAGAGRTGHEEVLASRDHGLELRSSRRRRTCRPARVRPSVGTPSRGTRIDIAVPSAATGGSTACTRMPPSSRTSTHGGSVVEVPAAERDQRDRELAHILLLGTPFRGAHRSPASVDPESVTAVDEEIGDLEGSVEKRLERSQRGMIGQSCTQRRPTPVLPSVRLVRLGRGSAAALAARPRVAGRRGPRAAASAVLTVGTKAGLSRPSAGSRLSSSPAPR